MSAADATSLAFRWHFRLLGRVQVAVVAAESAT
jgi:hypothetical protein